MYMALLREISGRRSCKRFDGRAVESVKLDQVVEAGRLAPSAKNRQEWRFIVVRRADLRDKIAAAAFREENVSTAPVIIAACTTNIDYMMPNGQHSHPIDLAVASSFMAIQAESEGLESCFITTFGEQDIKDLLSVPHRMRVVLLIVLGYPAADTDQQPRKPLQQIVSYEHW